MSPFLRDADVRHDFLARILGDRPFEIHEESESNASLCLADLALMRMLQRRLAARLGADHPSCVPFGKQFEPFCWRHRRSDPRKSGAR
ncbi:hypothetical protein [Sedimentitalea todarodis]|uniref:Uncharacterized protein n=1 Tax=Sedimentitalea todarodis TaxID=1631240 RepID=A0ABU3VBW3_9RHOB|nr:hypothetical protein [Sedimentitalea todarodis]MDU9003639.1 hypothetical protein [Sedimentitalea todarodis]